MLEDFGFKFQIGDNLMHAGATVFVGTEDKVYLHETRLACFHVVERVAQECHGGTQRFYVCRAVSPNGHIADPCFRLAETELVPYPPPSPKTDG